jgi:hypothetical protein
MRATDGRYGAFGKATLEGAAADLAAVPEGLEGNASRHVQAYAKGAHCAEYVGCGAIDERDIEPALFAAMEHNGYVAKYGAEKARDQIRAGIAEGLLSPKTPRDLAPRNGTAITSGATRTADAPAPHLEDVVATARHWLYIPDPRGLYVTLGAYAANWQEGEPVWLLIVAASGAGKTEAAVTLAGLEDVFPISTLTEASLLSGTPKKEKAKEATGGLLRAIGERGLLLVKDFTSILSMHRDARAGVLAALREIYDGAYTRHIGTDGGRTLSWSGRIGLIGCTTPVIDQHHAVMSAMGERFLLYRMPEVDRHELTRSALGHARSGAKMRAEIAGAVRALLDGVDLDGEPAPLDANETHQLIRMADYTAKARSAVERDGHTREIQLIVGAEAPTRLAIGLLRLLGGMRAIGVPSATAWRTTVKVALDCIPAIRKKTLDSLALGTPGVPWTTSEVAEAIAYPTQTTRRTLEDLHAYGMVDREVRGQGKADRWTLSQWTKDARDTVPEMSEGE